MDLSRRVFLQLCAASATAITIGGATTAAQQSTTAFHPSFFIELRRSGRVLVKVTRSELGQGVETTFAQIVADELGAALSDLDVEIWPYSYESDHLPEDFDGAGASMSLRLLWLPLRTAAAGLREMLVAAANEKASVPGAEFEVASGRVVRRGSGQSYAFSDLFAELQNQSLPESPVLRDNSEFDLVGTAVASLGALDIVTGKRTYSIDVDLPDIRHAVILRPPVKGARLKNYNADAALKVAGVERVFVVAPKEQVGDARSDWQVNFRGVVGGIAVVANSPWAAIKGREALEASWDLGANQGRSSDALIEGLADAIETADNEIYKYGDAEPVFATAPHSMERTYINPFQAQAPMEPLNAVAHWNNGGMTLWAGTQSQSFAGRYIADLLGIDKSKVRVEVYRSGGGFGRRYHYDFLAEAALVGREVDGPVKLFWTREDEFQNVRAHPARVEYIKAAFDKKGDPIAFKNTASTVQGDPMGIYGLFNPYAWGCAHGEDLYSWGPEKLIDTGSWRSVSAHWQTWARESFVDEVAHEFDRDPVALRLDWLSRPIASTDDPERRALIDQQRQRARHVLERANQIAATTQLAPGSARGAAVDRYGNTWVAQIAELSLAGGVPRIDRIVCVFDCGLVVNPQIVKAQIEGSIVWALQPVLFEALSIEYGQVVQSNFHDYQVPRMADCPEIEIEIVDSQMSPSGAGEPAVAPLAPAVANAYFALTGERKRCLPVFSQ